MTDLLKLWGDGEASELAQAMEARKRLGLPIEDFVTVNPFDFGFRFNEELLKSIMASATNRALRYGAEAFGRTDAREAVAAFHSNNKLETNPDHVVITPGTSLAYFYLFRLLASGGYANVLCPSPTYPLFDDLAAAAGIDVRRYHLTKTRTPDQITRWVIDPEELAFQITPQTRAIVLVSPHNPTGTVISAEEMTTIAEIANRSGLLVIHDEVFRNYTRESQFPPVVRPSECGIAFSVVLNGLSKSHYLPGLKAGWMVFDGCQSGSTANQFDPNRFLTSLEHLADTFLPVSDAVQAAIPELLTPITLNETHRLATLQRKRLNERLLCANNQGIQVDQPEAGPYICVPCSMAASSILEQTGALFHPGELYGLPKDYLVSTIFNPASWPPDLKIPKVCRD